jgi:hypothetical protein
MKLSRRSLHLALAALALGGLIMSRALWLAPMTMLWSATARADLPIPLQQLKPYQQYAVNDSCGTGSCGVTFPAVTAETLISQVSCWFDVPNTDGVLQAYLWNGLTFGSGAVFSFLPSTYYTYSGNEYSVINTQTQMYLSSGQTAQVLVSNNVGTMTSLGCSVFGWAGSALARAGITPPPSVAPTPPTPAGLPPSPGLPLFTRAPAQ